MKKITKKREVNKKDIICLDVDLDVYNEVITNSFLFKQELFRAITQDISLSFPW